MKGIIINKDIEEYENDVWRGFSLRQLIFAAASVGASVTIILFAWLVCYLPIEGAVYLGIPVGVVIALFGFMKIDDMNLTEYLKEMWRLAFLEPLTWQTEEYDVKKLEDLSRAGQVRAENEKMEKELGENESHDDDIRGNRHLFNMRGRNNHSRLHISRNHRPKNRRRMRP